MFVFSLYCLDCLANNVQHFKDRFDVSHRVLGQGSYGAVYLANEVATSRQIACKIIDIDQAADQLTNESGSDVVLEGWNERLRRLARGKELVMREVRILSRLSHVCISNLQFLSYTDMSQPHIINLKKAFITDNSLLVKIISVRAEYDLI
jgi:serine/threonine protein kinase